MSEENNILDELKNLVGGEGDLESKKEQVTEWLKANKDQVDLDKVKSILPEGLSSITDKFKVLDKDGDGSILDDVVDMAKSIFKKK